jgi:hypothetical protein
MSPANAVAAATVIGIARRDRGAAAGRQGGNGLATILASTKRQVIRGARPGRLRGTWETSE